MTVQFSERLILLPAFMTLVTLAGCDIASPDAGASGGHTDGQAGYHADASSEFRLDADGEGASNADLFILPADSLIFHSAEQDTSSRGDD